MKDGDLELYMRMRNVRRELAVEVVAQFVAGAVATAVLLALVGGVVWAGFALGRAFGVW